VEAIRAATSLWQSRRKKRTLPGPHPQREIPKAEVPVGGGEVLPPAEGKKLYRKKKGNHQTNLLRTWDTATGEKKERRGLPSTQVREKEIP